MISSASFCYEWEILFVSSKYGIFEDDKKFNASDAPGVYLCEISNVPSMSIIKASSCYIEVSSIPFCYELLKPKDYYPSIKTKLIMLNCCY